MAIDKSQIFSEWAIMRLAVGGAVRYGLWKKGRITLYEGSPFSGGTPGKQTVKAAEATLLAPCRPSKIVAVGLNYKAHAEEMKKPLPEEPMIFLKPSTAVIGPGQTIRRPAGATRVDYEAELGIVISRPCRLVSPEEAESYILGYTCVNDVTERHLQKKDIQYTRAKGFDTFCPLGPVIALDVDPADIQVKSILNGEVRQNSRTSDLIFNPARLVAFASSVMTLRPGDVIATGTPAGVAPMVAGDTVTVELEGIGQLSNPVRDAAAVS